MRHIGILAHSADGAGLCMLEMVRESARQLGEHQHPEITLSMRPMGPTLAAYDANEFSLIREYLAHSVERLARAGCEFFVCPDNTAHLALEATGPALALDGLHIAEVVARQARAEGRRRVGLLGTRWTMNGSVYPAALGRAGIEMRVPGQSEQEMVQRVIFEELCLGSVRADSRTAFARVVEGLAAEGCDAVALCCTEIPLLLTPETSPLPTLDSTRLLARAAVEVSLGRAPTPTWRGGHIG